MSEDSLNLVLQKNNQTKPCLLYTSHQPLIVASHNGSLPTACRRKVEHAPDEVAPQEFTFLKLFPICLLYTSEYSIKGSWKHSYNLSHGVYHRLTSKSATCQWFPSIVSALIVDHVPRKSWRKQRNTANPSISAQTAAVSSTMTSLLLEAGRLRKSMALSSN